MKPFSNAYDAIKKLFRKMFGKKDEEQLETTEEELAEALSNVEEDIIRIKGYVQSKEGTMYFNYVLNEYNIFLGSKREGSLVSIIGTAIDEDYFRELFHD